VGVAAGQRMGLSNRSTRQQVRGPLRRASSLSGTGATPGQGPLLLPGRRGGPLPGVPPEVGGDSRTSGPAARAPRRPTGPLNTSSQSDATHPTALLTVRIILATMAPWREAKTAEVPCRDEALPHPRGGDVMKITKNAKAIKAAVHSSNHALTVRSSALTWR
jgi:hypothetical protein